MSYDKLAEFIAQQSEPELREFVYEMEHTHPLTEVIQDGWDRIKKQAKTYDGLYFGLMTLLLMADYTKAKVVMTEADKKRVDDLDQRVRFLFINISDLRGETVVDDHTLVEYNDLYANVQSLIDEYDLDNGYWRRNGVPLSEDWDEANLYHNRVINGIDVYESMYRVLWVLTKLRNYMVVLMPPITVGV